MTSVSVTEPVAPMSDPSWDQPGGLGIREQRSWATWQMAVAAGLAVIVGMMIGYSGKKQSSTRSTGSGPVSLSGLGAGVTATTTPSRVGVQPGTPPTSAPVAPANSIAPSSGSAAAACNQPKGFLLPNTPGRGPDALPAFTTHGAWCIGWVFDCAGAPSGTATFDILGVTATGTTPIVQQSDRKAAGVTPQGAVGPQQLRVSTDPGCRWAVKVSST